VITPKERNRRSKNRSRAQERALARLILGERRTPLSGGMSGHTRSDVVDKVIYAEAKGASVPGGTNGWFWRWLIDVPRFRRWTVLTPTEALSLQHVRRLDALSTACEPKHGVPLLGEVPKKGVELWLDTVKKAAAENKTPLIGMRLHSRQGWWLLGRADVMGMLVERGRLAKEEG
jgi:hypothetical protein